MEKVDTFTYFQKSKQIDVTYWKLVRHVAKVCRSRAGTARGRQLNLELLHALIQLKIWKEQIKNSGFSNRLLMEKYKRAYKCIKEEEPEGEPKYPDYMKRDPYSVGLFN